MNIAILSITSIHNTLTIEQSFISNKTSISNFHQIIFDTKPKHVIMNIVISDCHNKGVNMESQDKEKVQYLATILEALSQFNLGENYEYTIFLLLLQKTTLELEFISKQSIDNILLSIETMLLAGIRRGVLVNKQIDNINNLNKN